MNESQRIKDYFQKIAKDYDIIYSQEKNFFGRFLDFLFRRSMQKRFEAALTECAQLSGKSIVDIGCGSGRYAVELAKRGAKLVVGIDFAENMLALARDLAQRQGVSESCRFIKADFLTYNFATKFDICIAIGILEYFKEPQQLLNKIRAIAQDRIIISLPVKWTLRSGLRKMRLALAGRPVYFYTNNRIRRLLQSVHLEDYKLIRIDRDYLIVIKT